MKKIIRKTECRGCREFFVKIKGLPHHDGKCCSEKCFISVPIIKPITPINIVKPPKLPRRAINKQRKDNKKRKIRNWDFYSSGPWLELRYEAIRKYGRECLACGTKKGSMHVDHILPRSFHPHLQLEFSNLQILCKDCNLGKLNRDSTDFRKKD